MQASTNQIIPQIETNYYIIDTAAAMQQLINDLRENNNQWQNIDIKIEHAWYDKGDTANNSALFKNFCIALTQHTMIRKLDLHISIDPLPEEDEKPLFEAITLHPSILYLYFNYTEVSKNNNTFFWKCLSQNKILEELELDVLFDLETLKWDVEILNFKKLIFNITHNPTVIEDVTLPLIFFLLEKSIKLESFKFFIVRIADKEDETLNKFNTNWFNKLKNNLKKNLLITDLQIGIELNTHNALPNASQHLDEFDRFRNLYLKRNYLIQKFLKCRNFIINFFSRNFRELELPGEEFSLSLTELSFKKILEQPNIDVKKLPHEFLYLLYELILSLSLSPLPLEKDALQLQTTINKQASQDESYLINNQNILLIKNEIKRYEKIIFLFRILYNSARYADFSEYTIEKLTLFCLIFKQLIDPNIFHTQDLNFVVKFLTPFCDWAEKTIAKYELEPLILENNSSYLFCKEIYFFASQNLLRIKAVLEQGDNHLDNKSENPNHKKRKLDENAQESRSKKIKSETSNSDNNNATHPSMTYSNSINSVSFFAGKKLGATETDRLKINLHNIFNHWDSLAFSNNSSALLQKETIAFGFIAHDVKRNGNCLFEAIVDQLKYLSLSVHSQYSQADLRMKAIQYLIDHREVYENFVANQSFESFIQKMSTSGTWGEHIVLTALCHALNMSIVIINSDGSAPVILKKQNAPLTIYLGYEVGLHYQSLHCDNEIKPSKDIQKFFEAATFIEEPKSKLSLNQ